MTLDAALANTLEYLKSDAAIESLERNPYWPKWDSPWWHMTTLNELGLVKKIPERVMRKLVERLNSHYPPVFIVDESDRAGHEKHPGGACHCMIGNVFQLLDAWGIDVDAEVPWMRPWFYRYQMEDGGMSCDEEPYRQKVSASSMVGTIACLEAVLYSSRNEFSEADIQFLDRGAKWLLNRKLMLGSDHPLNADEKQDEADWLKPCFPRLYFYDVLRGLSFVLNWASIRKQKIAASDLEPVLTVLEKKFPEGKVRVERHGHEGVETRFAKDGSERGPSFGFPLFDATSRLGEVSPALTLQWEGARARIENLKKRGLLV